MVKNLPANAGDVRDAGLIPGLGRSPGAGHGSPLQYSCLENPMDRAAWRATVQSLAWEDPLEENMATHSDICAWRIPMDREAWWATVHGVTESWT